MDIFNLATENLIMSTKQTKPTPKTTLRILDERFNSLVEAGNTIEDMQGLLLLMCNNLTCDRQELILGEMELNGLRTFFDIAVGELNRVGATLASEREYVKVA